MADGLKLYEICAELQFLLDGGDELDEEAFEKLDALQWALERKVQGCLEYRQSLLATAEAFEREAARLTSRSKAAEAKAERLRDYVKTCLERVGVTRIDAGTLRATIAKAPPSVQCDGAIPPEYVRRTVTESLDKTRVLADAKEGKELPSGVSVVQKTYLRVS